MKHLGRNDAPRSPRDLPQRPQVPMTRMQTGFEVQTTRAGLAATLAELIGRREQGRPFSPWERHCLGRAIKSLRVGNYEQARQQVSEAVTPPNPLPTFPFPDPVSVDELQKALGTIGGQ